MPVTVTLIPVITEVAWPLLQAAVVAVASGLGYTAAAGRATQIAQAWQEARGQEAQMHSVELPLTGVELSEEETRELQEMHFAREGLQVRFYRTSEGQCGLSVCGAGKSKEELGALAKELTQRVLQQMVYHRVVSALKARSFQVEESQLTEDQTIHLRVYRYS